MIDGIVRRLPVGLAARCGMLGPWAVLQDPRRLCQRLDLEGWRHLVEADEGPGRLVLRLPPSGPWQVALWSVAYYRGPVGVLLGPDLARGSLGGLDRVGARRLDDPAQVAGAERLALVGAAAPAGEAADEVDLDVETSFEEGGRIRVRFGSSG